LPVCVRVCKDCKVLVLKIVGSDKNFKLFVTGLVGNVLFWQQGDVASQYSYSSSSYPGQQAGTPSPATSAMYAQPQGYSQQTYIQQTYAQQQVHI